jgi:hypothetical protein
MGLLHCLLNEDTLCADAKENPLCVSVAIQNNKKMFGAINTTYKIFIAYFIYTLL